MKMAALLSAQVSEAVCQLPGVATLDWCERAAAALARLHHPCWVGTALGRVDARGTLSQLEVAGAAASTGETSASMPGRVVDLGRVRQGYRDGEWLGWSPYPVQDGVWFAGSAAQMGAVVRKNDNPLARRWAEVDPAEVILGAVTVGGAPGRMMVIEIASHDPALRDGARQLAVLSAVLPLVHRRLNSAVGSAPADKASWLTPREEIVLWHLASGKKVPEIAQELHRSIYTVHDHVKSLHKKLGASNRGQLVSRALGHIGPLPIAEPAEDKPKPAKASRPGG